MSDIESVRALATENARQIAQANTQGAQIKRAAQAELAQVEAKLAAMTAGAVVADPAKHGEYQTLVTQRDQLRRAVEN
ncbi:hypothetical protein [Burkholderia sp. Ac-20349]|uniref:hypothetical protein n=1 Tax=Burkholderia sp. Ac-20349 TaxID=2703893 RepID=UPI00197C986A|nr:hypothetical protein [Burkholderia sp. Ac-20349]MBN3839295.1 hypothetical protein [Burkholderia sp. Ac-20349]